MNTLRLLQSECDDIKLYRNILKSIIKLFTNAIENSGQRIKKTNSPKNTNFVKDVWTKRNAREFIIKYGWQVVDDHIVLLNTENIHTVVDILETAIDQSKGSTSSRSSKSQYKTPVSSKLSPSASAIASGTNGSYSEVVTPKMYAGKVVGKVRPVKNQSLSPFDDRCTCGNCTTDDSDSSESDSDSSCQCSDCVPETSSRSTRGSRARGRGASTARGRSSRGRVRQTRGPSRPAVRVTRGG